MGAPVSGERAILYIQRSKAQTFDLFRLPLTPGGTPAPIFESRLDKNEARVSPDGRAIAFVGSEGSRSDLYVAPLPITSTPILVETGTGPPRWSGDGRRLYYPGAKGIMSVAVQTGESRSRRPGRTARSSSLWHRR